MTKPKQKQKMYKCDLCDKVVAAATALGRHKQIVHGIAGMSKASIAARKKLANALNTQTVAEVDATVVHPNEVSPSAIATTKATEIATIKRKYVPRRIKIEKEVKTRPNDIDGENAIALITVGKFTAYAEAISEEYNLSKKSFTRRCAELFFASQVR